MASAPDASIKQRLAVAVVADCHVEAQDQDALCSTLQTIAKEHPRQLVLLGDIFERWTDTQRSVAKAHPLFTTLRTMAKNGTRIVMIRGNREVIADRRLETALGVPLQGVSTIIIAGQRIAFLHGEQLFDEPGLRALTMILHGFWMFPLLHALPGKMLDAATHCIRSFSRERNLRRIHTYSASRLRPNALLGAQHLILGHVHRAMNLQGKAMQCTVVAPWTANRPRWLAIHADGRMEER